MPTVPSLSVPAIDAKPFYAYVGAGDAAIASLRARVIALPETLKTVPGQISAQVASLPTLAQTLPVQAKELQAKLLKQRGELAGNVESLYDELATRGEQGVAELRGNKAKAKASSK